MVSNDASVPVRLQSGVAASGSVAVGNTHRLAGAFSATLAVASEVTVGASSHPQFYGRSSPADVPLPSRMA